MASRSIPECNNTTDDQLCPDHTNMHLEMYCETCERAVCYDCISEQDTEETNSDPGTRPVSHRDHTLKSKATYTTLIRKKRSEIEESCEVLSSLLKSCDKQADTIGEHAEELKGQVEEYLNKVQAEILDSSKEIMLELVTGMTESKKKDLTIRKQKAKEYEEKLSKAKAFLENQPNEKNASFYKELLDDTTRAIDGTKAIQPLPEKLQVNVKFQSSSAESFFRQFKTQLEKSVCLPMPIPASACNIRITGPGARVAVVREQAEFELTFTAVQDVTEVPYFILGSDVKCTLTPKSDDDPVMIECGCTKEANDRYTVCYTVEQPGVYLANIQVGSQRVSIHQLIITAINTGFRVDGQRQLGSTSPPIMVERLHEPLGIAVAANGKMAIVEGSANQVTLKKIGTQRKSFGRRGTAAGQFVGPCDVAFVDNTHIIVTDTGNHRIQKFTRAGQFVAQVAKEKIQPTAIAVDCLEKRVFILDKEENCVRALSFDLQFLDISIHCPDNAPLTCVGVDSVGGIIYVGCKEHYIHKYDQVQLQKCDQDRQPPINIKPQHENLHQPSCLCVSQLGLVFVGDAESNNILMFDSAGKCLQRFDNLGADNPKLPVFGNPSGLAVDASNILYYSDKDNNCLYVIRPMDLLL